MIIVYPAQNWNSFVTVTEAQTVMAMQFPQDAIKFNALPPEQQESLTFNAGTWIRTCPKINYPHPLPQDFILAQVAIMVQYMGIEDFMQYDSSEKSITNETVGELSVSYDPAHKGDKYDIHPLIYRYLSPYGCRKAGGFGMASLGRN